MADPTATGFSMPIYPHNTGKNTIASSSMQLITILLDGMVTAFLAIVGAGVGALVDETVGFLVFGRQDSGAKRLLEILWDSWLDQL